MAVISATVGPGSSNVAVGENVMAISGETVSSVGLAQHRVLCRVYFVPLGKGDVVEIGPFVAKD